MHGFITFTVSIFLTSVLTSVSADIRCYSCSSYMSQCRSEVSRYPSEVHRGVCSTKCFIRQGEDSATYRGCFDEFSRVAELTNDYVGCRNQTWNNRNLRWCFCQSDMCNGVSIEKLIASTKATTPLVTTTKTTTTTTTMTSTTIPVQVSLFAAKPSRYYDKSSLSNSRNIFKYIDEADDDENLTSGLPLFDPSVNEKAQTDDFKSADFRSGHQLGKEAHQPSRQGNLLSVTSESGLRHSGLQSITWEPERRHSDLKSVSSETDRRVDLKSLTLGTSDNEIIEEQLDQSDSFKNKKHRSNVADETSQSKSSEQGISADQGPEGKYKYRHTTLEENISSHFVRPIQKEMPERGFRKHHSIRKETQERSSELDTLKSHEKDKAVDKEASKNSEVHKHWSQELGVVEKVNQNEEESKMKMIHGDAKHSSRGLHLQELRKTISPNSIVDKGLTTDLSYEPRLFTISDDDEKEGEEDEEEEEEGLVDFKDKIASATGVADKDVKYSRRYLKEDELLLPPEDNYPLHLQQSFVSTDLAAQIECIGSGYYNHPSDCTLYIACVYDPYARVAVLHLMRCPELLFWENERKICVEHSVSCGRSSAGSFVTSKSANDSAEIRLGHIHDKSSPIDEP